MKIQETHSEQNAWTADDRRYDVLEYRRTGNSGVLLPPISLGLWKNFGSQTPFEKSLGLLHYAFDHGITHFDLANNYGPPYGSAEETFGKAMKQSLGRYRDEMFVATKAGYDMWPGPYGNWGSRKYLTASLHQSLRRMNLDYADLFYIHRYDPETPLDETLQALVDIVKRGEALYVGISRWPLEATQYAFRFFKEQNVRGLVYQGRLNLVSREPEETGVLDFLRQEKIGFVSFSPLAQGLLTDKYLHGTIPADSRMALGQTLRNDMLTPELLDRLMQLKTWATEHNESVSNLALRWVLSQTGVTSAIIGVSSKEQLDENIRTAQQPKLSEQELKEISKIMG